MAYETFGDLRKQALTKAGEVDTQQSKYWDKMLEYVQQSYLDVLSGSNKFNLDFSRGWDWARETDPIHTILKAPVTDGQITMVNGSLNGTFSVAPTISVEGWYLYIEGVNEVYRIAGHGATSAVFSIDSEYVGSGGNFSFKAVKLIYDLGNNILRLVEPFTCFKRPAFGNGEHQIYSIGVKRFKNDYPLRLIRQGMPAYFTVLSVKDDFFDVIFNGYVEEDTKIDIDFVASPSSMLETEKPLLPLKDREVLSFCAASMLLFNEKSATDKGALMLNLAKQKLEAMLNEDTQNLESTGRWFGRVIPRAEQMNSPYKYLIRGY